MGINVNRKRMGAAMAVGKGPLHRVLRGSSALCSLFSCLHGQLTFVMGKLNNDDR